MAESSDVKLLYNILYVFPSYWSAVISLVSCSVLYSPVTIHSINHLHGYLYFAYLRKDMFRTVLGLSGEYFWSILLGSVF